MKAFHFAVLIASLGLMSCGRAGPSDQDLASCRFETMKRFNLSLNHVIDADTEPNLFEFWQACMQARGYRFDPYLRDCTAPRTRRLYSPACYEPTSR